MVGYGFAAWPFLTAKYGLHQRWRVLTALIGVAALLAAALSFSSGARAATVARPGDARAGSLILKTEGEGYTDAERLGIDVDVTVSGPRFAPASPRYSATRPRIGSRRFMSIRCRMAARWIRSRW